MALQLRGFLALRHVNELVARTDQISTGEVEGLCPHCGAYVLIDLPLVPSFTPADAVAAEGRESGRG